MEKDPFYTNSSQMPVGATDDLFAVLDNQDELQCKYTGGTVLHAFLGERLPNGEAVKALLKKAFGKYKLPYLSVTPTFSICPKHGYIDGEHFECPKCVPEKQACEVYSRVVGYLRPVQQWNKGKKAEYAMRKVYKVENEKLNKQKIS